ncbi:uncharacterized protein LOC118281099 [Spodoptera frugiperda]|uniref:Uncharacterized protein LOC118281099 n=1 Tax=Spodoptera frugiperda TaxID=7108 RepID=A0A9R0DZV7_SPOFR|nr:uncharacterized protein LOC118281099 [Spodoptera frugiperda]
MSADSGWIPDHVAATMTDYDECAISLNETMILLHNKNFHEIQTMLKKVNKKLRDIGQLMRANGEVATLPVIVPAVLRNGGMKEKQNKTTTIATDLLNKTKPNTLENKGNSSTTTSVLTTLSNTTESLHNSSVKMKHLKSSTSVQRSSKKSTARTVVSSVKELKDNSTTSLKTTTDVTKTTSTAKTSVAVLRENRHKQVSDSDSSSEEYHSKEELLKAYYRLLEEYQEGYLVIFMMELAKQVAAKDVEDVHIILRHMAPILVETLKSKKLGWLGYPVTHVLLKFGLFVSDGPIHLVQNYSDMVYNMLRLRNTSLDADVNSIIDYAEILYDDNEGRRLFEALGDFEAYPNVSKTSTEVCKGLVDSFFKPYRRLLKSKRRQNLVDAITYVLKTSFPKRKSNDHDIISFIVHGNKYV